MERIKDSAKQLIENLAKKEKKQAFSTSIKPQDELIYDASCFINKKDAHTLPPQPHISQSEQLPYYKSGKEYKKLILNSKNIKDAIQIVANKRAQEQHLEQGTRLHEFVIQAEQEASSICDQMFADYKGIVTLLAKN